MLATQHTIATAGRRFALALALGCPAPAMASAAVIEHVVPIKPFRTHVNVNQLAWAALHENLLRWEKLPADWDGDDGIAPSKAVAETAAAFLRDAQQAGLTAPTDYVAGDGEVGYRWRGEDSFASVSFLMDGRIVGKARISGARTLRFNVASSEEMQTGELFNRIANFR